MSKDSFSIDKSIARIEEITIELESGDVDLQESIDLYKEGIELTKKVSEEIEKAETTILKLTPENVIEESDESFSF